MTANEQTVERVAKRICMADMGGDDDIANHPRIASRWLMKRDHYLDLARAAIAALPRDEWMPIETAPKDGTPFLVWEVVICDEEDEDGNIIARDLRMSPAKLRRKLVHAGWNFATGRDLCPKCAPPSKEGETR